MQQKALGTQTENAVKLSLPQLNDNNILNLLPAGVYICDKEGRITFFNDAAVRLWGYTPDINDDSLRYCACHGVWLMDGTFVPPHETPMAMAIKRGQSFRNVEALVERPDHTSFYANVNIDPIFDENNMLVGAVNVFQEITALKKTEIALRESEKRYRDLAFSLEKKVEEKTFDLQHYSDQLEFQNKELEQFAYAASHDMKEPLRKIHLYNSYIYQNAADKLDERSKDYLNRSIQAVNRMSKLIEDLLAYTKTTFLDDSFTDISLADIVKEVLSEHTEQLESHGITVTVEELPVIHAIPFQCKQLLDNLISNAIKYRQASRPATVHISSAANTGEGFGLDRLDAGRKYIRLSVVDNGLGFDNAYAHKIFEIFQRLDNNNNTVKGSGIGLAICKRIIQNHHGVITAEGHPDEGARFDMYFPAN